MSLPLYKLSKSLVHITRDDAPDESILQGYYTSSPVASDLPKAIDRQALKHMRRGEHRFFIPSFSADETGNPESPMRDYLRAESICKGELDSTSIQLEYIYEVSFQSFNPKAPKEETSPSPPPLLLIRSSSIWGVDSNSGLEYYLNLAQDLFEEVFPSLAAIDLGFLPSEGSISLGHTQRLQRLASFKKAYLDKLKKDLAESLKEKGYTLG